MFIENRTARLVVVALSVLLLIPLVVMLGMMVTGSGMMAQMGGGMTACGLGSVLVAVALISLIYLVTTGSAHPRVR